MHKNILLSALLLSALSACASSSNSLKERKSEIYLSAGVEALMNNDLPTAIGSLTEAVKLTPKSTAALNNLGLAYAAKEIYPKAEEYWKKAISVDPEFTDAKSNLGALYIKTKRLAEAEKILKECLQDLTYAKTFQIHFNLGLIYSEQRKTLSAEQQYLLAVQNNSVYCPAWLKLGMLQKNKGEIEEAENSLKKAVSGTCFNNPEVHFEISSLYVKQKDIPKAKAKLLEIIQIFPRSDWAKKAELTLNMIR